MTAKMWITLLLHSTWALAASEYDVAVPYWQGALGKQKRCGHLNVTAVFSASLIQNKVHTGVAHGLAEEMLASPGTSATMKQSASLPAHSTGGLFNELEHLIAMACTVVALALGITWFRLPGNMQVGGTSSSAQGSKQIVLEDTEEVPIMEQKGSPLALFIDAWAQLAPVLAPVALIVIFNNKDAFSNVDLREHSFVMNCAHNTDTIAALCSYSRPAVRLFPVWASVCGVLMAAWKMLHTRVYYVLMKHRIMILFHDGKRTSFYVGITVCLIYLVVALHFWLMLLYDWPCNDEATCGKERFLNNGIRQVILNPRLLNSKENKYFLPMVKKMVTQYLVPGIVAVLFLFRMDDLVAQLVPMNQYFQDGARKRYHALGKFVLVPEPIAYQIVETILRQEPGMKHVSAACRLFKRVAHDDFQCTELSDTCDEQERERKQADGLAGGITHGIKSLFLMNWWPSKLLLTLPLADEDSSAFKKAIVSFYSQTVIIVVIMATLSVRRAIVLASGEGLDLKNGFDNRAFDRIFETVVPALSSICLVIILSSILLQILGQDTAAKNEKVSSKESSANASAAGEKQ
eukprot:TRINITY_DN23289_c0_g1_i1.p1 TRINITY_DN23289_c0_g1~~TRINITY_DN23289_c0_g1_i1.p1  ORF type:complete len:575 (+),score=89.85 TRINITY_DN23289_c0_g1_i1:36-1760(+)